MSAFTLACREISGCILKGFYIWEVFVFFLFIIVYLLLLLELLLEIQRMIFFCRFPYFLPCLCISLFSLVVGIASIWLPVNLYDYVDDFCVYGTCCFCQILFAVIQLVFHLRRKLEIQYVGSLHIVVCLSFFFLLVLVAYNMLKECKLRLNW